MEILRDLRKGDFDVLVGVNLLREGLDLPEVSLVAILDADKAGFLRSETSLIQTIGRAARNVNAKVILYADTITPAMQKAIDETSRRREPCSSSTTRSTASPRRRSRRRSAASIESRGEGPPHGRRKRSTRTTSELDQTEIVKLLEEEMLEAAQNLEFERAAQLRDKINEIKGAPTIRSGSAWGPAEEEGNRQKIWQPKTSTKHGKRRAAK